MDFSQIIGHDNIIKLLKNSIKSNRVNHSYIFNGSKGMGKLSLAKAFAKTLNCHKGGLEPCNECISCKTFEENNNPDIIYIQHKTSIISVDDIREQIIKNISLKPFINKYKIFIIADAHKMNEAAQNAFLKSLEEPPDYSIFLILSENINNLLITILSRCITINLNPLPYNLIADYLVHSQGLSNEQGYIYSKYSMGSIGKAIELISSSTFNDVRDNAIEIAHKLESADMIDMYNIIESIKDDRATLDTTLEIIYMIYRDVLVLLKTKSKDKLIQTDKFFIINEIAKTASISQLIRRCDCIEFTRDKLRNNGNSYLLLETLFFNIKEK